MGSTSGTTSSETDRLAARFRACRDAGRHALIPFLTAGYPAPEQTVELMQRLEAAGARVYRTDRDGAVILESDGRAVRVTAWARGTTDTFHLPAPVDEMPEQTPENTRAPG